MPVAAHGYFVLAAVLPADATVRVRGVPVGGIDPDFRGLLTRAIR